jgi:hypothetical protein
VHDEIESLKRDKNVLMLELVRLRQQQQVGSRNQLELSLAHSSSCTACRWVPDRQQMCMLQVLQMC